LEQEARSVADELTPETIDSPVDLLNDPAIGAYVFFSKHFPLEVGTDPRLQLVSLIERSNSHLRLDTAGPALHSHTDEINLFDVHTSSPQKTVLINLLRQNDSEVNQALAFTFLDSFTAQVMHSRVGTFSVPQVKVDAEQFVTQVVTPQLLAPSEEGVWGSLLVLWAVVPPNAQFTDLLNYVSSTFTASADKLFRCDFGVFVPIKIAQHDALLLLTYDNREAENWANQILFQHTPALPPALLLLALAGSKFDWEFAQYRAVKPTLDVLSTQIDRRLNWMIDAQRAYERRLRIVGSRESAELLGKLSRATTDYADFGRAVTRVNELRTTLQINAENFLTRLNALTPNVEVDNLFRARWQQMERIKAQMEYESAYFDAVLQRGQTILDAARARLDILHGEQEREQLAFQGIQTSAITAIMTGLAALQILPVISGLGSQWFIGALIIFLMALTFSGSQLLFNWNRVKTAADRVSVAITCGLLLSLPIVAMWSVRPTRVQLLLGLTLLVSGLIVGYVACLYFEERQRRTAERERALKVSEVKDTIDSLLVRAREELLQLLEDLPPTEIHRVKARASLSEKLDRKGYKDLTEVGDEIGIRYVVAPWEIPRTVRRICSLVRTREIEYKQGDYKAVHILADLLGPGDDRDLDLTAEIQVKTHWQNRFAIFAHDRLYKTQGGRPGVTARFYGWLLARISDLELLLFRRSMGWPQNTSHGEN
jgi:hypothetical protein